MHPPGEEETLLNAGHLLHKSPSLIEKREKNMRKKILSPKNVEESSKLISQVATTKTIPTCHTCIVKTVEHTFHLIIDHFIQPLIDGIIHVVPFWDLTLLSFP